MGNSNNSPRLDQINFKIYKKSLQESEHPVVLLDHSFQIVNHNAKFQSIIKGSDKIKTKIDSIEFQPFFNSSKDEVFKKLALNEIKEQYFEWTFLNSSKENIKLNGYFYPFLVEENKFYQLVFQRLKNNKIKNENENIDIKKNEEDKRKLKSKFENEQEEEDDEEDEEDEDEDEDEESDQDKDLEIKRKKLKEKGKEKESKEEIEKKKKKKNEGEKEDGEEKKKKEDEEGETEFKNEKISEKSQEINSLMQISQSLICLGTKEETEKNEELKSKNNSSNRKPTNPLSLLRYIDEWEEEFNVEEHVDTIKKLIRSQPDHKIERDVVSDLNYIIDQYEKMKKYHQNKFCKLHTKMKEETQKKRNQYKVLEEDLGKRLSITQNEKEVKRKLEEENEKLHNTLNELYSFFQKEDERIGQIQSFIENKNLNLKN
ncbi:pre-mRNA 3'-end-processing factor fip1 [Anaeramoeba flamelloides]|uniref:Pre-mRNA 3'-end-processing factor fip1 n=1 Tax=Anaeramoeba flamelloides TaxID=1746091 RepID=A0ABQ8XD20_9EUKA|nr:pre-mRNA 3'-end-processing factor fip1 [Anaeramoeba flamelloides]